jgi:hypothetical protein
MGHEMLPQELDCVYFVRSRAKRSRTNTLNSLYTDPFMLRYRSMYRSRAPFDTSGRTAEDRFVQVIHAQTSKPRDCRQNALIRADMKNLLSFSGIVTRLVVACPS